YGQGIAQLTSTIADANTNLQTKWYAASTGGTPLITNANYTTPNLTGNQSYFVAGYDPATTCESARTQVDVTVLPMGGPGTTITTQAVRMAGVTDDSQLYNLSQTAQTTMVSYLDGLQRTVQTVAQKTSPLGNDVITPVEYDPFGRTAKDYLPYVNGTTGTYHTNYASEQLTFYNTAGDKVADDPSPYALARYERTPDGRLLEQGGIGQAWQPVNSGTPRTQRYYTSYNNGATADPLEEVRLFNIDGTSTGYYAANTLVRAQRTDANGNVEVTYTDPRGRLLARKQQLGETIGGVTVNWLETYYVYDAMDRLKYTVPPKATAALKAASWVLSQTLLDNLCFQYVYDYRGRTTQTKSPGQAVQYVVYDVLNRPVLTQNGLQRASNQWAFVKYDVRNRPVMTGLYTDATNTTLAAMQTLANGLYTAANATYPPGSFYESRGTALHGYGNASFPKTNADGSALTVYTASYFDDYDFDYNGTADYAYANQGMANEAAQGRAFGLATGSKRLVLGTSTWLYTYVFYDMYGRPTQVRSNNHLSTVVDNLATAVLDFEGKKLTTKTYHNAGGTNQTTVQNRYVYDAKGRPLQVYQTNNTNPEQQLAQYDYNELGQVVDKKLHVTGGVPLQSVDYRYDVRGWLTSINNAQLANDLSTNDDTNDLFGLELLYHTTNAALGNVADYTGKASALKWKSPYAPTGSAGQRAYTYGYDKMGQLKNATYKMYGTTAWDQQVGAYSESQTYDHGGNIVTLTRSQNQRGLSGATVTNATVAIDQLTYSYTANTHRLLKVTDAAANPAGFTDGANVATEYTYDTHGNQKTDQNKTITATTYNALGKVQQLTFADGRTVVYTYDGQGTKLKAATTVSAVTTTAHYIAGFVYTNSTLSFFSSPEGRVVKNGSVLDQQYAIADHQGNTRLIFSSSTPSPNAPLATFEGDANDQSAQYSNVNAIPFGSANHTPGGSRVVRLNQTAPTGPGYKKKVYPGDKIDMEAWSYYESGSGYGTNSTVATMVTSIASAFGGVSGGAGESGLIYNGVNSALTGFGLGANQGDGAPAAYLNYILFDQQYKVVDMGWQVITATAFAAQQVTIPQRTVKEAGYVYVYLSYENQSNNYVYFDDFKVTVTPTNVVQYSEYYPFGLQTANSWTRENSTNNFLYNEGSELNATTSVYDLEFRNYDPALERLNQIDPLASLDHTLTPYHYAGNDPISFNDPLGLARRQQNNGGFGDWTEDDAGARRQDGSSGGGSGGIWSWSTTVPSIFSSNRYGMGGSGPRIWSPWGGSYQYTDEQGRLHYSGEWLDLYSFEGARLAANKLGVDSRVEIDWGSLSFTDGFANGFMFNSIKASLWREFYTDNVARLQGLPDRVGRDLR
ncbi:MAG: DUF6443 domain-containing protein, partial [Flammeovirgaceae bacterium]